MLFEGSGLRWYSQRYKNAPTSIIQDVSSESLPIAHAPADEHVSHIAMMPPTLRCCHCYDDSLAPTHLQHPSAIPVREHCDVPRLSFLRRITSDRPRGPRSRDARCGENPRSQLSKHLSCSGTWDRLHTHWTPLHRL